MLILRILIILGVAIFSCCAIAFGVMLIYIVAKVLPQVRKENYLLEHGYHCEKGYWCKGDRSLAGDWIYRMTMPRLRDYIERAEEKDSQEETL